MAASNFTCSCCRKARNAPVGLAKPEGWSKLLPPDDGRPYFICETCSFEVISKIQDMSRRD